MRMPETIVWNTAGAEQNKQLVPEGKRGFFTCKPKETTANTTTAKFYSGTANTDPQVGFSFMFSTFRGFHDHSKVPFAFRDGLYAECDRNDQDFIVHVWIDTTCFHV